MMECLVKLQRLLLLCLVASSAFVYAGEGEQERKIFSKFFTYSLGWNGKGVHTIEDLEKCAQEFLKTNPQFSTADVEAFFHFKKDPKIRHALISWGNLSESTRNLGKETAEIVTKTSVELLIKYCLRSIDPTQQNQQRQQWVNEKTALLDKVMQAINSAQLSPEEKG